jgi:hypothetical protein
VHIPEEMVVKSGLMRQELPPTGVDLGLTKEILELREQLTDKQEWVWLAEKAQALAVEEDI